MHRIDLGRQDLEVLPPFFSLLIAFVCPSLTNASAKILLFNPFLEALKTENFGSYGVTVNTYKANRLYYTSICVRW